VKEYKNRGRSGGILDRRFVGGKILKISSKNKNR